MTGPLTIFDRPNSYIGRDVPRPDARRLSEGRGRFVDDKQLPRMVHAAFLASCARSHLVAGPDRGEVVTRCRRRICRD